MISQQDAMVLSAETVERRLDTVQALDVAFVGFQETRQRAQILNRDGCGMARMSALA